MSRPVNSFAVTGAEENPVIVLFTTANFHREKTRERLHLVLLNIWTAMLFEGVCGIRRKADRSPGRRHASPSQWLKTVWTDPGGSYGLAGLRQLAEGLVERLRAVVEGGKRCEMKANEGLARAAERRCPSKSSLRCRCPDTGEAHGKMTLVRWNFYETYLTSPRARSVCFPSSSIFSPALSLPLVIRSQNSGPYSFLSRAYLL